MKYFKLLILLLLIPLTVWAVATTITGTGNWSDSGNWAGADIGNVITDDVTMNNNLGTITIQNAESFTIGSFVIGNGNTLTIDDGGSLIIGSMSTSGDLVTGNTTTINVNGNLEIWGNININNTLVLTVGMNGTFTVHGDIVMGNNSVLDIQGNLTVDGNFTAGNNTDFTVNGQVNVGGNFSVDNGSVLDGTGNVNVTGTCSDSGTNICSQNQLPIVLLSFNVFAKIDFVLLEWTTASEVNNDYFTIEKSKDGKDFAILETVSGAGNSLYVLKYSFKDIIPFPGLSYYRLSQTDYDGTAEVFDIASVDFNNSSIKLVIYPNPVNPGGVITIRLDAVPEQFSKIRIYDMNGNSVFDSTFEQLSNKLELPVNLSEGFYLIELNTGREILRSKLLIR